MRILLTGESGFTGWHLINRAQVLGHEFVSLEADLQKPKDIESCLNDLKFDYVLHLAAISFVGHSDPAAFYAINTVGTTNLLNALVKLSKTPKKVVIASSANVYGNTTSSPVKESQTPKPINHYASSKVAMEHMIQIYSDKLPIVVGRPFNYTGPRQRVDFVIPKLVKYFKDRERVAELGNLDVEREFNDVRMVCDAYFKLLQDAPAGEVYNICSGKAHTLQTVIEQLQSITGHKLDVQINPSFVRPNELKSLYGCPQKLLDLFNDEPLNIPNLKDTLSWMLTEHTS